MADKASRNGLSRGDHKAAVLALKPAPGPRAPGVRWDDNLATVAVRGDLDREAIWAIDYTVGRASVEAGRIVLDLRQVTHLDYSGVPEIVARRRELLARGWRSADRGAKPVCVEHPQGGGRVRAGALSQPGGGHRGGKGTGCGGVPCAREDDA